MTVHKKLVENSITGKKGFFLAQFLIRFTKYLKFLVILSYYNYEVK
jgi:hypothetical protein